jgi:transcriptional regulator with XRE-family HTH domain
MSHIDQPVTRRDRMMLARRRKGWTQAELSRRAGLRQATVSAIERSMQDGSRVMPMIAKELDVPLEWLVVGENPPTWATQPDPLEDAGSPQAIIHRSMQLLADALATAIADIIAQARRP